MLAGLRKKLARLLAPELKDETPSETREWEQSKKKAERQAVIALTEAGYTKGEVEAYKINDALALSKFLKKYMADHPEESAQMFLDLEKASREQSFGIMHLLAEAKMVSKKLDRLDKAIIGEEDLSISKALLAQLREIRDKVQDFEGKPSQEKVEEVEVELNEMEDRLTTMPLWGKALKLIQAKAGDQATIEEICSALGKDYNRNSDRKQVYAALKHVENSPEFNVGVIKKGREKSYYYKKS